MDVQTVQPFRLWTTIFFVKGAVRLYLSKILTVVKTSKHKPFKIDAIFTFGNKQGVGVYFLVKGGMFLKNDKSLHEIKFPFLACYQTMQYKHAN